MEVKIPEKLVEIMKKVVKPDEFTPTLESWVQTVIEDAVEDYVQQADHDTQMEWYDYCAKETAETMKPLFDKIL